MTSTRTDSIEFLHDKFTEILTTIAELRAMTYQTKGILFVRHTYSQDALLQNPLLLRITAMASVIENLFESWQRYQAVDQSLEIFYYKNKLLVETAIHSLMDEIGSRRPTFWEQARSLLLGIVRKIASLAIGHDHLPRIGKD
jgi:hypothetical protein